VGSIQPATACIGMTWIRMIITFLKREEYSEEERPIKPKIFTVCPLWKCADPCCRLLNIEMCIIAVKKNGDN